MHIIWQRIKVESPWNPFISLRLHWKLYFFISGTSENLCAHTWLFSPRHIHNICRRFAHNDIIKLRWAIFWILWVLLKKPALRAWASRFNKQTYTVHCPQKCRPLQSAHVHISYPSSAHADFFVHKTKSESHDVERHF